MAAELSVEISKMLRQEFDVHVDDEIFWTDGQVVTYVNSDVCQFKDFIANRVQQIYDHSTKQWHLTESSNYHADGASHGLDSQIKNQIKVLISNI